MYNKTTIGFNTLLNKILVIRFSAMGDVILTSPILRCLKKKYPASEIHFLVKNKFREAIASNIHVNTIHSFDDSPREILSALKKIGFDVVVDLQNNRKSASLRAALGVKHYTFPKLNIQKFLLTFFKINRLPKVHVVDRYFKAVEPIGVTNDQKGLDFYLNDQAQLEPGHKGFAQQPYIALVLGATYFTKRIPLSKLEEIIRELSMPVVLLGGPGEMEVAKQLQNTFPELYSTVGQTNLQQSAWLIQNAFAVITPDTGLMHIAAAFNKKIISVWGNTVPDFGMSPYMPMHTELNISFEIKSLKCRPCSKLGHHQCPKKHFKCMMEHDAKKIALSAEQSL